MEQPDGNKTTIWHRWSQQIAGITAFVVALGGLVSTLERCGDASSPPPAVHDSGSTAAADGAADAGGDAVDAGAEVAAADDDSGDAPAAELLIDASADPEQGAPPLVVGFTASVEGGVGDLAYEWDFGDGSAKSNKSGPTHRYTKPGEYTVVVRVKDAEETEGETQVVVTVTDE